MRPECAAARLLFCTVSVLFLPGPGEAPLSAQARSIPAGALADWSSQGDTLVKLANVMPEDKFRFKPTPPQRDYGEQILHIAEANVVQMGRLGAKVTPPTINMKAASKAEIVKALEESFDYGIAVLHEQTDQAMVQA